MVQSSEQLVSTDAERYLLVYMIAVLVVVTALVVLFFIVFQKRKNKLLLDKITQQREFEEEIANLFNNAKIRAPVHLYYGNEENIINVFKKIKKKQKINKELLKKTHPLVENLIY